jgi:GntR family transcriptional regulator, rspAB operon transcriptional repressor
MTKDEVYETLQQEIVTNTIPAGEVLNEKDLMERFSIGRSPLRDVLVKLHMEELLNSFPRLGYLVTSHDISEVRELVELRRELEGFVGTLATERISQEQLLRIKSVVEKAEREQPTQASIKNISDYFDTQFHNILYEATQNRRLVKILGELHIKMLRIWFHIGFDAVEFSTKIEGMKKVIQALEEKDAQKARKALEEHMDVYAAQMKEKFITFK